MLAKYGPAARLLAGGTDVIPMMKRGAMLPEHLINLKTIPRLNIIKKSGKNLRIGALTTVESIKENELIRKKFISLYESAYDLGTFQCRSMATVGGNICRASPAADLAPPLLALDANVIVNSAKGKRTISIENFFLNPGENALKPYEILTEFSIPALPPHTGTSFMKLGRTAEDLAKINAAVTITVSGNVCKYARIALGSVAPTPMRARKAEEALVGNKLDDGVIEDAAKQAAYETKPVSDTRSTAAYRKEVSRIITRRMIRTAVERAK